MVHPETSFLPEVRVKKVSIKKISGESDSSKDSPRTKQASISTGISIAAYLGAIGLGLICLAVEIWAIPRGFDMTDEGWQYQYFSHPEHYEAVLATCWPDVPDYAAYGPDKIDMRPEIRAAKKKYPNVGSEPLAFPEEVSQSAWITSRALDFIEETDADQALFAHVSYVAPHPPFCPPSETMGDVTPENIPAAVPAEWLHSDDAINRMINSMITSNTDSEYRTAMHSATDGRQLHDASITPL